MTRALLKNEMLLFIELKNFFRRYDHFLKSVTRHFHLGHFSKQTFFAAHFCNIILPSFGTWSRILSPPSFYEIPGLRYPFDFFRKKIFRKSLKNCCISFAMNWDNEWIYSTQWMKINNSLFFQELIGIISESN